jgi:CheY-like chemotaxis protein
MSSPSLNIPIGKLKNMTILYIESNLSLHPDKELFLKPLCKKLFVAQNGLEGLVYFVEYHIDMIITDIDMPIMNGNKMIEKIRSMDKDIPIALSSDLHTNHIILLASLNNQIKKISKWMGINITTVTKPYHKPVILQIA